ncbi:hypothetical protein BDW74DRAFT_2992 [Aspergillus multicolor]|uniref:putative C6 transcription factor n=1 Tax=Aspergillus multicolor TaxID=41759 RepID=UPI003CCDA313
MEDTSSERNVTDQPQQLATPLDSDPGSPFPPSSNTTGARFPSRPSPTASEAKVLIPRSNASDRVLGHARIPRACANCQKKKTKCDGRKPTCGLCLRSGTLCAYTKSKRENQQLQVQSLEQRVLAYESLLREIVSQSPQDNRQSIHDAIQSRFQASPEFFSTLLAPNPRTEQHISSPKPGLSLARMHQAWQSSERSSTLALLQQPPVRITSIQHWTSLVDDEVASHLLSLYFTWENPTWHLIDQTLFVHDLEHRRTRFCSSLLVHTLLFFGCSFSYNLTRITDRREEKVLGEKLYAAIQRLWLQEKESSDLPTIQSSILIGLLCCTFGIDKMGTNYIIHAAELSDKLKLDKSDCPYFSSDTSDERTMISNCQKLVSWAIFDIQALACQVYRKASSYEEPPAVRFYPEETTMLDEGFEWRPYPFQAPVSQPFFYTAARVRSGLVAIVHDIARFALRFPGPILTREDWAYGSNLHRMLLDWHNLLPWSVLPRHNTTPHVLCLHLYYQSTIVSLCEIFLLNADPTSIPPFPSFDPLRLKFQALDVIGSLILIYKSTHGYKSIPIVMLHYFCVAGVHAVSRLHPDSPRWGLVLESSVIGLWHMSLGWGRLCKAFLRTIDLVLKARSPDESLIPPKVTSILSQINGNLWTGMDTGALAADYVVYHVPDDLGKAPGKGNGGFKAHALQELLAALEGLDVS